eukprot:TRINITY_DN34651_c0_g1_i1.p1 TRINITY_DN34651_c0_g1~~TRINITY_DN34651_c0_g1_i1.p1  ORF type:complete len:605 (+),score=153.96 TRINITY_DN34651_c0_g1_i1:119-1816(+)
MPAWLASAITGLTGLADVLEPLALLQVYQSQRYHREAMSQERTLHDDAVRESLGMHKEELSKSSELTQKELSAANALHREALRQAETLFSRETDLARDIMRKDHELTNSLHDVSMWAQRLLHSDNKKYTLKLFRKELEHAQNVSRKENIRDTMVQESQRAQAIMIVDTLMFGCCFGVIIEGNLPPETDEALVIAFSISLSIAFTFLIISVWFAMNLQSRIAKYRISDPTNVLYGKRGRQLSNFRSYFGRYCKPVYRLTHAFLWFGTVALLMNGAILVGCKFSYTNKSNTAAGLFIVTTAVCIFVLSFLLWLYNPKLRRSLKIEEEADFRGFKDFVAQMEDDLTRHDHECKKCRLPTDIFKFCPTTGQSHPVSNVCPSCNIPRESFRFCPTTGDLHEIHGPSFSPPTEGGSQPNPLNALNSGFGPEAGRGAAGAAGSGEGSGSPSLKRTALDVAGRGYLGTVESPRGTRSDFAQCSEAELAKLAHSAPALGGKRVFISRLTPPVTPEYAARLSPIVHNIGVLRDPPLGAPNFSGPGRGGEHSRHHDLAVSCAVETPPDSPSSMSDS